MIHYPNRRDSNPMIRRTDQTISDSDQASQFSIPKPNDFATPSMAEAAAVASSSSAAEAEEEELTLIVRWSGKDYTVRVCGDDSVAELKRRICELTNVLPKRQKLLYPKLGDKLANDSFLLSQLPLKSSLKMTMIGFLSLSLPPSPKLSVSLLSFDCFVVEIVKMKISSMRGVLTIDQ